MSMDKAVLRQFAQMLNAELSEEGIFVGIVNIMSVVGSDETHQPSKLRTSIGNYITSRMNLK